MNLGDIPISLLTKYERKVSYGRAHSGNTDMIMFTNGVKVYFSYETIVAFEVPEGVKYVHQNIWSATTGKHLALIDHDNKDFRFPKEQFETLFKTMCEAYE